MQVFGSIQLIFCTCTHFRVAAEWTQAGSLITPSAGKMDDAANERDVHNATPKKARR